MYRRHGQKLAVVFLACDLAVTAAVWIGAYLLRFAYVPSPHGVPDFRLVLAGLPTVLVLAAVSYRLSGLYEVHRLRQLPRELGAICAASGLLFVLAITVTFYRRDLYESRLALAIFGALNIVALAVTRRMIWQGVAALRTRGLNHGRALIVGAGRTGRRVAEAIGNHRWTGLEAVGFVDRPLKVEPTSPPRLGAIDQLKQVIIDYDVDHVFIALPLTRYGELAEIHRALDDLLVEVQLVPDLPNLAGMRAQTLEIDALTFLSLRGNPHHGWYRLAKRSMDVALGSLALVIFSPLMLLLAALIKLTSQGPILVRQSRTGMGGQTFCMLKFRSMRADAEDATGAVWAVRNDPRCTPLGRFMRRYNLDELAQLFNVVAGHMSLVGPRPERKVFVESFRRQLPTYTQRHRVKAGMTGWAQVNGWRGNTSLRRRLEYDLFYISNWSLWLDLKILCLTLWQSFRPRNAF